MEDVGKIFYTYVSSNPKFYMLLKDFFNYYYIDLENGEYHFDDEEEFLEISAYSKLDTRIYLKNTIENITRILNALNGYAGADFDYYWYSTIKKYSDLKNASDFNTYSDADKLKDDISYHRPRYIYIKRHDEDIYLIRYEIIYNGIETEEKQVTKKAVIKEQKQDKGENNIMKNFEDLFTFKQIDVKMDFMSGNLVLDDEGHYFSNGQVMQTLPEMTVKMPAYIISTPVAQLAIGDIILYNDEYVCLLKVTGNFEGINLKGEITKFSVPTHALFGANMQLLPKVMSLFQNMNMNMSNGAMAQTPFGQFNPMMFAFMEEADQGEKITMEKMMKYSFYAQAMNSFQPMMANIPAMQTAPAKNIVELNTGANVEENIEEGEDGVTE